MRPEPIFIGDHPAMDFLNSIAAPWAETIDWIEAGDDLVQWMVQASLLDESDAQRLLSSATQAALDQAATQVRELREAFRQQMPHPDDAFLQSVSLIMSQGHMFYALEGSAQPTAVLKPLIRDADSLLPIIAHAIVDFACTTERARRRSCNGSTCTLWYYDISKSNRRRWCSMAICGNRAKVAAHRARKT